MLSFYCSSNSYMRPVFLKEEGSERCSSIILCVCECVYAYVAGTISSDRTLSLVVPSRQKFCRAFRFLFLVSFVYNCTSPWKRKDLNEMLTPLWSLHPVMTTGPFLQVRGAPEKTQNKQREGWLQSGA